MPATTEVNVDNFIIRPTLGATVITWL